jgi:hypothetical protein
MELHSISGETHTYGLSLPVEFEPCERKTLLVIFGEVYTTTPFRKLVVHIVDQYNESSALAHFLLIYPGFSEYRFV